MSKLFKENGKYYTELGQHLEYTLNEKISEVLSTYDLKEENVREVVAVIHSAAQLIALEMLGYNVYFRK